MTQIFSGKEVAAQVSSQLADQVLALKAENIFPKLAIVRIGERLSDVRYERGALNRCAKLGIEVQVHALPEQATQKELMDVIHTINGDNSVHGCLLLRPFPKGFDDAYIRGSLAPEKDVDGITDASLAGLVTGTPTGFSPCTAAACMAVLDHYHIPVEGKNVVIIGASLVIGRPVAMEFLKREATVTICHIKTKDVGLYTRTADIIVAAAGHWNLVTADMVKPGQVILDVGINPAPGGGLCGDVDFANVAPLIDGITPVPGGIGSVTTSILAQHVVQSAAKTARP